MCDGKLVPRNFCLCDGYLVPERLNACEAGVVEVGGATGGVNIKIKKEQIGYICSNKKY